MKSFFDSITRLSLRFRTTTLVSVVVIMVLGGIAATRLKQELLPPIEFPQTFILAQVSGMSSEQVLTVLTSRLEAEISTIPEIVNLTSTSTGAFGAVITAANDFGLNQARLRDNIQAAIDRVWLPQRAITAAEGENPQEFGQARIAEITPELAVYFAQRNNNFAFDLSPEVWLALNDDTFNALLAYLANQTLTEEEGKSALERLVEQEVVPQLQNVVQVASVQISGGQALPGEEALFQASGVNANAEAKSFLLQLSPTVWDAIQSRVAGLGELNQETVDQLASNAYPEVAIAPELPAGWQAPHFSTATDILEMQSLTRSVGRVLNDFYNTGVIRGALGQTDDLTPEVVTQMLAIDATLVNTFTAEQLVALPADVFAVLPADFVAGLDGFTRDALAAAAVARELGGDAAITPLDLPSAWRIQPPQIITFNLSSIPLATYSVFSTSTGDSQLFASGNAVGAISMPSTEITPELVLPPAPALPEFFALIGEQFGATLDSADDLINVQLSGPIAEQFGVTSIRGADLLNQLAQNPSFGLGGTSGTGGTPSNINVAEFTQALLGCGLNLFEIDLQNPNVAQLVIGCLPADAFQYLLDNDPTFLNALSPEVFEYLRPDVLALEGVSPPLGAVWNTLAQQPQFDNQPLRRAADVVTLGGGRASVVLNQINASVPASFTGYEVRLFDSLAPATVRYFVSQEPEFFANLDEVVVLKLSPAILQLIPDDVRETFDTETQTQIAAIIDGTQPSAGMVLASAEVSETDVEPTDPNAPALDPLWGTIASNAPGVDQLLNASDLLRLPENYGGAAGFFDLLLERAGDFAPRLIGSLSIEAISYVAERDADFLNNLSVRALRSLNPSVLAALPQAIQDKAASVEVFIPTRQVTRTNGEPALLVTIIKDQNANTVEAYYNIKAIMEEIDANNPNIQVAIAFEQSSLVEKSISGVAREGVLGSFFAVLTILVFLSGGVWGLGGRRMTGFIILVVSTIVLVLVVASQLETAGGDLVRAWDVSDVILRILAIGGIATGLGILLFRGSLASPAWRSTLVIAVSIPLSIAVALALMLWLPPAMNSILAPLADSSPIFAFLARLFPANLTLNIMTLSGLTVAVGRVVDDSIVVLENIFRQMQDRKISKREAILTGTRDVSVAIFSATGITVVVFLPLGLTGGLIGEFFLPFGLAVTYALLSSFVVAITVVPVLVELFVSSDEAHEEQTGALERWYASALTWTLKTRLNSTLVIGLALISLVIGGLLFLGRPQAFIPDFGEPEIAVNITMPNGTTMLQTNEVALRAEEIIRATVPDEKIRTIRTIVGGGGLSLASLTGGSSVNEARAQLTINTTSGEELDEITEIVREVMLRELGEEIVKVSKSSLTSQGGFGGFELVMSGDDQAQLVSVESCVTKVLNTVEGVTNVTSNLAQTGLSGQPCPTITFEGELTGVATPELQTQVLTAIRESIGDAKLIVSVELEAGVHVEISSLDSLSLDSQAENVLGVLTNFSEFENVVRVENEVTENAEASEGASGVFIRINEQPAFSFTGEVITEDTINLATKALTAIETQMTLPEGVTIGQGYNSQFQQQGFSGIFVAMGIAIVIVIFILFLVFGSPVYWFAVIFSIAVAPVGAAIALTLTDRTLGISALIGLLMLLGLVVTNAVVLIDRVSSNRHERKMNTHDALIEGGERRLRPIIMTALATIFALMPLAFGLSEGAIIAEELGTVVIGGLFSSTILTLVAVPALYYLTTPLHNFFIRKDRETE
jgi:multidrug efflux pump subunit AcrB